MRWLGYGMIGWAGIIAGAGCRTATKIVEVPRVDLEVSHATGNRGYVVGTPPSAEPWKTTRQMVRTDIEIPSLYAPTRTSKPIDLGPGGRRNGQEDGKRDEGREAPQRHVAGGGAAPRPGSRASRLTISNIRFAARSEVI